MKNIKRFASVVMVIMMMLSMMIPAMAGTITVSNTVVGETYSAYKIFDVKYSGTGTTSDYANYSYTIEGDSDWYNVVYAYAAANPNELTLTATADSTDNTYIVNMPVDGQTLNLNAAQFAAYLMAKKGDITTNEYTEATSDTTTITVAKAGYYLVDSTFGALCILNTADDNVQVAEKNAKPTLTKTVKEDSTEEYGESATADIGQTVDFKLTVNVGTEVVASLGTGNDEDFVITDTLPSGMTYVANSATIAGWTEDDFTVTYEGKVLTITLKTAKLATLESATAFDILYQATLDSNAVVEGNGNINTAKLTYSKYTTVDDTATVYTYAFDVVKTDGTNHLNGAKFELYDAETGGNKIALVKDGDVYRKATPAEIAADGFVSAVIEAGTARITGLDNLDDETEYWLEEIEAPTGYNALDGRVEVTAVNGTGETVGQNDPEIIVNKSGTELPSTGGIGTTIFYCAGAILAVGAFVLLITKKRMSKEV